MDAVEGPVLKHGTLIFAFEVTIDTVVSPLLHGLDACRAPQISINFLAFPALTILCNRSDVNGNIMYDIVVIVIVIDTNIFNYLHSL